LCNLPALTEGCVIYSLGSNAKFEFEMEMIFRTPCEIYTFDCTKDPLPDLHPRIHYHMLCLGDSDDPTSRYRSLSSIAAQFGHSKIALLKMDIEGFEYTVIESLYRGVTLAGGAPGAALVLPAQISFEQHYRSAMPLAWNDGGAWPPIELQSLSTGDMAITWAQLADMGYVVVSREDNVECQWCVEWTIVRAFC
jgi:Methyltransferase domain